MNIINIYLFVDGFEGDKVGCSRAQVLYFNYRIEQTIIFMSYMGPPVLNLAYIKTELKFLFM
mgnify:CR=1 FL=1